MVVGDERGGGCIAFTFQMFDGKTVILFRTRKEMEYRKRYLPADRHIRLCFHNRSMYHLGLSSDLLSFANSVEAPSKFPLSHGPEDVTLGSTKVRIH